jgi:lipopolysaccharide transport system permease protein
MLDKRNIFLPEKYQQAEPFLNKLPLNKTFLNVINPHADHPTSVLALAKSLWRNRQLIVQMTKREVIVRYQGSVFGLAWSFLNPLFMLVIYTFVFSEIFNSRWGGVGGDDSKTQFAIVLFVGMIVLSLFSELDSLQR